MTLRKGSSTCHAMLRRGRFDYQKNEITGSRNYKAVAGPKLCGLLQYYVDGIARVSKIRKFMSDDPFRAVCDSAIRDTFLVFRPTTRNSVGHGRHGNSN